MHSGVLSNAPILRSRWSGWKPDVRIWGVRCSNYLCSLLYCDINKRIRSHLDNPSHNFCFLAHFYDWIISYFALCWLDDYVGCYERVLELLFEHFEGSVIFPFCYLGLERLSWCSIPFLVWKWHWDIGFE